MEHREISTLKVNPNNPRGEVVVDDSLRELAESIRSQGVLQPILITPDGTIVCGHRRVKASEIAALTTVPCVVRELSEHQQIQVMLIENLQREDLTTLQIAKAYQILLDYGLSIKEIAKATGFQSQTITRSVDILKLHPELHGAFDGERRLALASIPYLIDLPEDQQLRVGTLAQQCGWTVGKIARECLITKSPLALVVENENNGPQIDRTLLDRIYERVDNGCYTPEAIMKCDECGCQVFPTLTLENIKTYLDELVKQSRCRWTPQGGRKENQRGPMVMLCMPVENEIGSFRGAADAFQRQPKSNQRA